MLVFPPNDARQRLRKIIPPATNTHARIAELLDAMFSMRSVSYKVIFSERKVGGLEWVSVCVGGRGKSQLVSERSL